jgi:3-hydroxybutyryl-CoA dehydrogenase
MRASDIKRIAVVGAGLMGHGIALEFAACGYDVRLHDRDGAQLERARAGITDGLRQLGEIDRAPAAGLAAAPDRIVMDTDLKSAVVDTDLVIEAVTEDLDVKRALFRDLDRWAAPHAILASNTSTFLPSDLAAATQRPDRVLVTHYFHPPYLLPLVELVRGELTTDDTVETMRDLYRHLGKAPAVVQKEVPGFVGNRLHMALYREALAIVAAGIASPQDVDTIVKTGFGRKLGIAGPFELSDASGLDVFLAVTERLFPQIDASSEVSPLLRDRVARGELGVKSGSGFYHWTPEATVALKQRLGQGLAAIARLADS